MKLIKPYFEIIEQEPRLEGIYKQIEQAGRTCYMSSDKITEDSAKKFVDMLIKRGHTSCLEHGTVYLRSTYDISEIGSWRRSLGYKYDSNRYSEVITGISADFRDIYITTNLRVLYENNWLDDLKYICKPTEYHEKRVTVRFVCDRGVSHEFVRHRVFSFAQESTRYCNYSKDKFGNELTFIIPCWLDSIKDGDSFIYDECIDLWQKSEDPNTSNFLQSIAWSEKNYLVLLHNKWTPQQARAVLPNALKTELVMTGFISDWEHFFELRCDKAAHPQARELAIPLQDEFVKRGYLKN